MIFEAFNKLLVFPFRALEGSGVCGRRVRRVVESRIKGFAVKDRDCMVSLFVAIQLFVAQKCATWSCCLGRPDMFGSWSRRKLLEVCATYRQAAALHRRCQSGGWLESSGSCFFNFDHGCKAPIPKPFTLHPQLLNPASKGPT